MVGELLYIVYSFVSIWGGGGGNLVPRWDKGSFYIWDLVTGRKGGMVEGGQVDVCAYLLFYY